MNAPRPSNRFAIGPESIVPGQSQQENGEQQQGGEQPPPRDDAPPAGSTPAREPFIPPAPVRRGPRVKVNVYLDPETAERFDRMLRELAGPGLPMGRVADVIIGYGMADVERVRGRLGT